MRIRLYGGPGHGRMVYIPASVAIPPPVISMPRMSPLEYTQLVGLDPGLEGQPIAVAYGFSKLWDPDGYARYAWIEADSSQPE